MKIFEVIKMMAFDGTFLNADQDINVTAHFGKCFIQKGSDYRDAAWGCEVDLPFQFVWIWEAKDVLSDRMLETADVILEPKYQPDTRILIWEYKY